MNNKIMSINLSCLLFTLFDFKCWAWLINKSLWIFEYLFKNFNEFLSLASIYVAMVDNKVAINYSSNLNFSVVDHWLLMDGIGRYQEHTFHKTCKRCSCVFESKHTQRCYTCCSKLVLFNG